MGPKGAVIAGVTPDGPAARAGLQPEDELVLVNGRRPADLMDVLDQAARGAVRVRVRRGDREFESTLEADDDEPLGIDFTDTLFTRVKTCRNKCVFCFMDQMPKRMRPSLYYRDDDFRLSALHGNFITLTNLSDEEWQRIEQQRVSPLYVSVHATETDLRDELLGRTTRSRTDVMQALQRLIEWGITVHTQIVLCPGVNDGPHLDRSLEDLSGLYPGVETVAVVPVGLTRYREHLPLLKPVTAEMVPGLIRQVGRFQRLNLERYGHPVAFLADEVYLIGGLPMPPHGHYLDYPQVENGVGMVRHFLVDFNRRKRFLPARLERPLRWLMVTGEYGGVIFPPLLDELHRRVEGLAVRLLPVRNEFFGHLVKCAGLLTGRDILAALEPEREFLSQTGTRVLIPSVALKDAAVFNPGRLNAGELFLDDVPMQGMADRFAVPFVAGGSFCDEWLGAVLGRRPGQELVPDPSQPTPIEIMDFPLHAASSCRT
ncbi:MAG: DUF512 domain-containing protein [Candidatus Eremiobacterota bacterium]